LYEHKITQSLAKKLPFSRLFDWLMGLIPGGGNVSNVVPLSAAEQPALKPSEKDEEFDFAADFASQFDEDAA
jgi:hypothetical protein